MSTARKAPLIDHFADLEDPRIDRMKDHPLINVLFIAICAVISGAEGWTDMETFGESKRKWLAQFLDLSNGTPSDDTFRRVISRLDPAAFEDRFHRWTAAVGPSFRSAFFIQFRMICSVDWLLGEARGCSSVSGEFDDSVSELIGVWWTCSWHGLSRSVSKVKECPPYRVRSIGVWWFLSGGVFQEHSTFFLIWFGLFGFRFRSFLFGVAVLVSGKTLSIGGGGADFCFEEVGRSLKTTNSIENLNSLVEDYIGNVKRWHHSEQRARWFALGLLEAEQRMNRIAGHEDLPKLRDALQRELDLSEKNREEGPVKEPLSE